MDEFIALLNAYWLRPETALWRACDMHAMRGFSFESPSLDLGCGDGVFSFIRAGGRFAPSFDVFQAVSRLDRYFENVDVYDTAGQIIAPVEVAPKYKISVGLDRKATMLAKASVLPIYDRLIEADANARLPFEDGTFRSVFSNTIYWLDDPKGVFSEIRRILAPNGSACFLLPDARFRELRFSHPLLDRGRTANVKHARSDWSDIARAAGLLVISDTTHLSASVLQFWDTGLRPIFPMLHRMASRLGDELLEVKEQWVNVFYSLLSPLLNDDPGVFHRLIVTR